MKKTQVSAHAIQLTTYGFVNCYLVREPDGFTVIDTGLSCGEDAIVDMARQRGAPVRRIALTHAHVDHVGSVDALMARVPEGVQLAASARSLPLLRKPPDKSLEPGEAEGKIKGGLPGIRTVPDHVLKPGELYGSLRVLSTPGHIPGHLSFLDERDGTLYAGDALIAMGRLAVSGFAPWYFPLPNLATWNKGVALESARKLLEVQFERVAAGHGAVRGGGRAELAEAVRSAEG